MTEQFKITKISEDIFKIEETWFKEHANLYLFKGDKFNLLVDCGLGFFNIKEFLQKEGFKNIKVALTHSHFDHAIGAKHFLPEEVMVNSKICKNLKDERMWGLNYFSPNDLKLGLQSSFNIKEAQDYFSQIKPRKLKKINIGTFLFEVVGLPGHTNDSVGYYDKKHKILVTGDALYPGKIYSDFPNFDKLKFKKSLKIISALDFESVLPGHNKILNKKGTNEIISEWNLW